MKQVRVEQPFILYAKCRVDYDGRAKSTLEAGNHLIIHKNDGTLLIHGGALCTPLNYQPPGAILYKQGNQLISKRKDETIIITVEETLSYDELCDWSSKKIEIHKTERELRDFIADNLETILGVKFLEVYTEFQTPVGNVDILGIDEFEVYHVIEVKRGSASLASCSQLERYSNYFIEIMKTVKDYLACPKISANALKYAADMRQTWVQIDHDAVQGQSLSGNSLSSHI